MNQIIYQYICQRINSLQRRAVSLVNYLKQRIASLQRRAVSLVNYLKQRIASLQRRTVSLANHLKRCRRSIFKISAFFLLFLVFMYSLKLYSSMSSFKASNEHNAAVQLSLNYPSGASAPHSKWLPENLVIPEIIDDMAECTKAEPLVVIPLEIIDSGIENVEIIAIGVSLDTAQNKDITNITLGDIKAIYTRFKHKIPVKSDWGPSLCHSLPEGPRIILILYKAK